MAASVQAVPIVSEKDWSDVDKRLDVDSSEQEKVSSSAADAEAPDSRPHGMCQSPMSSHIHFFGLTIPLFF